MEWSYLRSEEKRRGGGEGGGGGGEGRRAGAGAGTGAGGVELIGHSNICLSNSIFYSILHRLHTYIQIYIHAYIRSLCVMGCRMMNVRFMVVVTLRK